MLKREKKNQSLFKLFKKKKKKSSTTEAIVKEEKKPELNIQPVDKAGEKKAELAHTDEQKVDSVGKNLKTEEVYKKSLVTKISAVATIEGFESVFIDEYQNGNKDTIRIVIPGDKKEQVTKEESKPDSTKETKKFLDVIPDSTRAINKSSEGKKEETKKWWPFTKSKTAKAEMKKCQTVAANDDFLKLRRKMAGRTNDDGMLEEAKKYFRVKCFTTEQIKNLSSMFLSNAGKYNFFEAAHNYVSDAQHFSSLQAELSEEYYINRFKELVHN